MKRHRILSGDFDSRPMILAMEIRDDWEDRDKESWRQNKQKTEECLLYQFGFESREAKRQNFIDLGAKPMSILAFHNRFFEQIRVSFIVGAYYPALTAACTLGERILNHLTLLLRDDYKDTPEYKGVYRKDSFDNWDVPIAVLESWNVLLPEAANLFRTLRDMRQEAIHFRSEVDQNDRDYALRSIKCLQEIIEKQFSAFGKGPWVFSVPGEVYLKKEWEDQPFIRKVFVPNCQHVGPRHTVEAIVPRFVVNDAFEYENREITDEEFCELRISSRGH
jgi:hypothetical protein